MTLPISLGGREPFVEETVDGSLPAFLAVPGVGKAIRDTLPQVGEQLAADLLKALLPLQSV